MYRILNYKNNDFNLLNILENVSLFINLSNDKVEIFTDKYEKEFSKYLELEKEKNLQLPSFSKVLKRKHHKLSNIKTKLKKFINKEELKVHRDEILNNIKIDNIDFFKPLECKDFSLIDIINNINENIWIEIKANKIKYNIDNEIETLSHIYNNLNSLANNKIEYLLRKHIPSEIIKRVFNTQIDDISFSKAYESIKKLINSFNPEQLYFTKIKIYGKQEEIESAIKKIEKYFLNDSVEFVEENKVKSRFDLFFAHDEIQNFFSLPFKSQQLEKELDIGDKYALILDEEKHCFVAKGNSTGEETDFDLKNIENLQIKYHHSKKEEFKDVLQRILLYNIQKRLKEGNDIKVYNINFDYEEYIPKINSLKTFDLVSFINTERELEIFWTNLQEEIKRKTNKVKANIFEYNQNQKMQNLKEPITIISLNTDSVKLPQKIFDLLDKNHLGIYFIFYSKRKKYFNNLTFLEISDNIKLFSKKFNLIKNIPKPNDKILDEIMKHKESTQKDYFIVPIGVDDYGNEINFSFGEMSESYSAIIVGAPGTGKTSLISNILVETAKKYTAKEIQFILMDYKPGGVEFNLFKNHPNVHCITLNPNELEIALCIFQYIKSIIDERSKKFNKYNVQNITQYNHLKIETLPKIIIIIDEFQRLLTGDIELRTQLNEFISDFARMGRAFGIHLILSTQSLLNVTLNEDILSSSKIRISLKVYNMQDLGNVFNDIESKEQALRLKKHQCIYNNNSGLYEYNTIVNIYPPKNKEEMENLFNKLKEHRNIDEIEEAKIVNKLEDILDKLEFECNSNYNDIYEIDNETKRLIQENQELENYIDFE